MSRWRHADWVIDKHTDTERRVLPDAASIWCLLGKLYHTDGKQKQSIEAFVQAVKLNPFIWEAFEGLLDTGNYWPCEFGVLC